ncbi:Uncharacterised protein [Mycobacteroides abscessus subsp. abscessus]|nr:Uncharacterised protein [Mycobacteroides abscessus subsp. abscessus]
MAERILRWISSPILSRTARTASSVLLSRAVVQPVAISGSSATTSARLRLGVVDVGEVGRLVNEVEVDLGDEMAL